MSRATQVQRLAQDVARSFGYRYGLLTDGTIVLEPPLDPRCCKTCREVTNMEKVEVTAGFTGEGKPWCERCGVPADTGLCTCIDAGEDGREKRPYSGGPKTVR